KPEQEQSWLFLAVTSATMATIRTTPLLLVLDDLHWADRASLDLFTHLVLGVADASLLEPVPLMIVATHRPDARQPMAGQLARVGREEGCRHIDLDGLGPEDSAVLANSLSLHRSSRQLDDFLYKASGGNPLFLENLVHQIARRSDGGEGLSAAAVSDLDLSGP